MFAFTAQLQFIILKLLTMLFRCIDSGTGCDGIVTKKLVKYTYYQMYVGPIFDIGTRYSEVNTSNLIISNLDTVYDFYWINILFRYAFVILCYCTLPSTDVLD